MLILKDISVIYSNTSESVLNKIDLVIKDPSVILIVGESGSGKSTLANTIMGILHKFQKTKISGSISIDNKEYDEIEFEEINKRIGYLPQYPADFVLNQLVEDEISFPLENLGLPLDEINARTEEILNALRITDLKNRVMSELSSGELQKVALATTIAPNPNILILDEPFSRIDSSSAINLLQIFIELRKKGLILIIFEHHLDNLLEIADRLIVIDKGKIISDSSPHDSHKLLAESLAPELMKIKFPNDSNRYYEAETIFKILKSKGQEN